MRYISVFREENSNSVEYPNYNILNFKYITANSSVEKAFNFKTDIQINKDFIKSSVTFNFRNYYKTKTIFIRKFSTKIDFCRFLLITLMLGCIESKKVWNKRGYQ